MDESEKKDLIVELSLILMDEPIELVVELINQVNGNNDIVFIPDTVH